MVRGPRTAMRSGPRSPQLEKALAQKRRPNRAIHTYIHTYINKIKKKKTIPITDQIKGQGICIYWANFSQAFYTQNYFTCLQIIEELPKFLFIWVISIN